MVAWDLASSSLVMMLSSTKQKNEVMLAMRNKDYGNLNHSAGKATDQPTISNSSTSYPSPNTVPTELTIKPPKGVIHKSTFNPHARAAQKCNIVEDLGQSPSTMSSLKV